MISARGDIDTTANKNQTSKKQSSLQLEDISYSQDEIIVMPKAVVVEIQENHPVVPEQ